jgi:hypothetical protein
MSGRKGNQGIITTMELKSMTLQGIRRKIKKRGKNLDESHAQAQRKMEMTLSFTLMLCLPTFPD